MQSEIAQLLTMHPTVHGHWAHTGSLMLLVLVVQYATFATAQVKKCVYVKECWPCGINVRDYCTMESEQILLLLNCNAHRICGVMATSMDSYSYSYTTNNKPQAGPGRLSR
jgi:hypothetical protein